MATDKGLEEIPEGEHLAALCDNHTAPTIVEATPEERGLIKLFWQVKSSPTMTKPSTLSTP
jgi:TusA-related sulfurtransferase